VLTLPEQGQLKEGRPVGNGWVNLITALEGDRRAYWPKARLSPFPPLSHHNPYWGKLKAGEERSTHLRVYLIQGTLDDLWSRYRADWSPPRPECLRELWRTRLGVRCWP